MGEHGELQALRRTGVVSSANVHAAVVAAVAVVMIGVWLIGRTPDQQANAAIAPASESPAPEAPPPPPALPRLATIHAPVMRGDNLSMIFQRHQLLAADLQRVLDSGALGRRLKDIHPGHAFEFAVDDDGNLLRMEYRPARFETVTFERVGDSFESRKDVVEPDKEMRYVRQEIDSSLFGACHKAGLGDGFAIVRFAARHDDIRAAFGEGQHHRPAQAAAAAGYQSDFAAEIEQIGHALASSNGAEDRSLP